MYASAFTALTHSNLNDLTTTFAQKVDLDVGTAENSLVRTIDGFFDTRGSQRAKILPMVRVVPYLVVKDTPEELNDFEATLMFVDRGEAGTITYKTEGSPSFSYTAPARLLGVSCRRSLQEFGMTKMHVELTVQELEPLS
ncbi:MAG: hypothetical protein OT477_14815 [Chloroflexi bacterium]|nr:hypothetical protein [Chloroflexota bacterium]